MFESHSVIQSFSQSVFLSIFSVFSEYISDHSFFNGRKFILISSNFVVGVSVLFEELDEIDIVGDDDELKVFASAEFDQSQ
jgi:hypothetical protein